MSPMIKRITYKIGHCFSPRLKLIIAVGVARDIFFVNAERTHGAPLVAVSYTHLFDGSELSSWTIKALG